MNEPSDLEDTLSEGSPKFKQGAISMHATSVDCIDELDFDEFGPAMKFCTMNTALQQVSISTKKKQDALTNLQSESLTFSQPPDSSNK